MDRSQFLSDPDVQGFLKWAGQFVRGDRKLHHHWTDSRGNKFECGNLYEAFDRYYWKGKATLNCQLYEVRCFDKTVALFDLFKEEFRKCRALATQNDQQRFINCSNAILDWGDIKNLKKLQAWQQLGVTDFRTRIESAIRLLSPDSAVIEKGRFTKLDMGAGYSKIYAMLMDDFPMYDSRTACALTSLIVKYCEENGMQRVPETLQLGVPRPQGNVNYRIPASRYNIRSIDSGQKSAYASANVKAAWLLGNLALCEGQFKTQPPGRRVLALQSALFMVGYEPLSFKPKRLDSREPAHSPE